jgi:hypothetical protein
MIVSLAEYFQNEANAEREMVTDDTRAHAPVTVSNICLGVSVWRTAVKQGS